LSKSSSNLQNILADLDNVDWKVEPSVPISPYLITPAVLNCVPDEKDIASYTSRETNAGRIRKVFLNTPLDAEEQVWLQALRQYIKEKNISLHPLLEKDLLRFLQHAKGNIEQTEQLLEANLQFKRLICPVSDEEIMNEIRSGFMYWHGRDKKQRPILVIQTAYLNCELAPSSIVRLVSFCLEWMIAHGLVPGKVENWTVLVDLQKTGLRSVSVETIRTLVTTLHMNYRFRNTKVLIINCPWIGSSMYKLISPLLPADTKDKVTFCSGSEQQKLLEETVEMRQLEKKFGGTAEDRTLPEHFYPYTFFPDETKKQILDKIPAEYISKGFLWETHEDVPEGTREKMQDLAKPYLVTPSAGEYLTNLFKMKKLPTAIPPIEQTLEAIQNYCRPPAAEEPVTEAKPEPQKVCASNSIADLPRLSSSRTPIPIPAQVSIDVIKRDPNCPIAALEKQNAIQREKDQRKEMMECCQRIADAVNKNKLDEAVEILRKREGNLEARVIDQIEILDLSNTIVPLMTEPPEETDEDNSSREQSEPGDALNAKNSMPSPTDLNITIGDNVAKSIIPEDAEGIILEDDEAAPGGWCCRSKIPIPKRKSKATSLNSSKGSKRSKKSASNAVDA